jgi:hypothetical protein
MDIVDLIDGWAAVTAAAVLVVLASVAAMEATTGVAWAAV